MNRRAFLGILAGGSAAVLANPRAALANLAFGEQGLIPPTSGNLDYTDIEVVLRELAFAITDRLQADRWPTLAERFPAGAGGSRIGESISAQGEVVTLGHQLSLTWCNDDDRLVFTGREFREHWIVPAAVYFAQQIQFHGIEVFAALSVDMRGVEDVARVRTQAIALRGLTLYDIQRDQIAMRVDALGGEIPSHRAANLRRRIQHESQILKQRIRHRLGSYRVLPIPE